MHILHVIDSLKVWGGAERMMVELANRACADGYQISVCITRTGDDLANELLPAVRLYVLERRWRFDWRAVRLRKLVKDKQVDVLHVHGRFSFSLVAFLKAFGLVRRPIILHDHFGKIETDDSVPLWFRYWGRHHLNHFVGVCSRLGQWARRTGIPAKRVSVIENALDLTRIRGACAVDLRKQFGIDSQTLIGIITCNLRYEKGIDVFVQAFARSSLRDCATVLIVGEEVDPKYVEGCRAMVSSLGLGNRVLFTGRRRDVCSLLKGADFALMPSRSESGPLVLIEYMVAGLPFVSSLTGSISQHVAELGLPEFVPPNDPIALAGALDRMLRLTREERNQRGKTGQEVALQEFDIHRIMPKWYALYNVVTARS